MKTEDQLELLDGSGKVYTAKIKRLQKEKILCEVISSRIEETEPKVQITIAQSLPKFQKMDLIIQKCTELGAHKIIPMLTERSIGKSPKLNRWQRIAKEAAEQSGRGLIPAITPLQKFTDILKIAKEYDLALIPWELEKKQTLKEIKLSESQKILILNGPEGGFSQNEIKQAQAAGVLPISLGKRILRTETAGMAILAILMHELE